MYCESIPIWAQIVIHGFEGQGLVHGFLFGRIHPCNTHLTSLGMVALAVAEYTAVRELLSRTCG